jgi:nitric oxide synthase oxygenase domain/subunit
MRAAFHTIEVYGLLTWTGGTNNLLDVIRLILRYPNEVRGWVEIPKLLVQELSEAEMAKQVLEVLRGFSYTSGDKYPQSLAAI